MKPKKNKGDYIKATGAEWGAVWNGNHWEKFGCVGCAYALKLITGERLQVADFLSVKIGPRQNKYIHDVEVHNKWLQDGKPITKESR